MKRISEKTLRRSRHLRRNMTDAERALWYHLRKQQFLGLRFRRQYPIGDYIVDFVCLQKKLIIELDGGQHQLRANYDQRRTNELQQRGYIVIRFWNNEVLADIRLVLDALKNRLGAMH